MLTFGGRNKVFELDGDLLKTIANFDFNAHYSSLLDERLVYEFAKKNEI